jgi:hypothetical protein
MVSDSHRLLLEIYHHFGKLALWRLIRVQTHLLCHFGDNDIPYIIVLETVVLVTRLTTF